MAAGDVTVDIVTAPITTATIESALTALITTAGADATWSMIPINNGTAVLLVAVDIA